MLYDRLYEKHGDRDAALKEYRRIRIPLFIGCAVLIPLTLVSAAYLIGGHFGRRFSPVSAALILICSLLLVIISFLKDLKGDYRYVHCHRDANLCVKGFTGGDTTLVTEGADGFIFSFTSDNGAVTECTFCDGTYTFRVKNDEWDEVAVFYAAAEEEFDGAAKKALSFASAIEKRPGGEYDETLQPEVEIDEYEDAPDEDDEPGEDEDDTKTETITLEDQ